MEFKIVNFGDKRTYCASESLVEEAKEKNSNFYLNFAYTNYGGTFFDKVVIAYFKENHPESIVYEETSWNGENAFIFGNAAKEFVEESNYYLLGFEDIEDFYFSLEMDMIIEAANDFYECNKDLFIIEKYEAVDLITEYLEGYHVEPNYVDYCESDLEAYLNGCGCLLQPSDIAV